MRWLVAAVAGALIAALSPAASALSAAPVASSSSAAVQTRTSAALVDGIGYYNPDDGTFHLRNQVLSSGHSDYACQFGPVGNVVALAGDWDGDGKDGIGYYNRADGTFHLRNDATRPGPSDYAFQFGPIGVYVIPVAGDWDGDGRTGIGYYNAGNVHLRNVVQPLGPSNYVHPYVVEEPYNQVISGDWIGTGRDGLAVSHPYCQPKCDAVSYEQLDIRYDARTAGPVDVSKTFYYYAFEPMVAGDWNGDGTDSVALLDDFRGPTMTSIAICDPPAPSCEAPFGPQDQASAYAVQLVAGRWH